MPFRDRAAYKVALIGSNMYVPAMNYSSEMCEGQPSVFSLGTPALAAAAAIATGVAANAVAGTQAHFETAWTSDATYGRNVVVTPSGVPGNANVIKVHGRDYLGQPMTETFTGSAAASAALVGNKAFYGRIWTEIVTPSTNAITFTVGTGSKLGLPYKGLVVFAKENNVTLLTAASQANQTAADLTDPATGVTGDPRGTYTATAALDGIKEIVVGLLGDNAVNASGNGGMHGIRHFS
jgi:hypothetical protein